MEPNELTILNLLVFTQYGALDNHLNNMESLPRFWSITHGEINVMVDFDWADTPEGCAYWCDIADEINGILYDEVRR